MSETQKQSLKSILLKIKEADQEYEKRTQLVYQALALAAQIGYKCGIRYDSDEENAGQWPVVAIQLPTGEVSWHCKATDLAFDGYATKTKFERIKTFLVPPKTSAVEQYADQIGQTVDEEVSQTCLETCPPRCYGNVKLTLDGISATASFGNSGSSGAKCEAYASLYDALVAAEKPINPIEITDHAVEEIEREMNEIHLENDGDTFLEFKPGDELYPYDCSK